VAYRGYIAPLRINEAGEHLDLAADAPEIGVRGAHAVDQYDGWAVVVRIVEILYANGINAGGPVYAEVDLAIIAADAREKAVLQQGLFVSRTQRD